MKTPDPPEGSSSNGNRPAPRDPASAALKPRLRLFTAILVFASIALPFFFWQSTWFGAKLSHDELRAYLAGEKGPRKMQHALVQFADLDSDDPGVAALFPAVAALSDHELSEIRMTAAWAMGGHPGVEIFHDALNDLVLDPVPLVRRNAALALSQYDDPACKPVLRAMLQPFEVKSPVAGAVSGMLAKGQPVRANIHLATIVTPDGQSLDVEAPVDGKLTDIASGNGQDVEAGDVLCRLSPGEADMWEALRALYLVGRPEDIPLIQAALDRHAPSERVARQAELTIEAINRRAGNS